MREWLNVLDANAGKQPAETCRLSVADYKASNGYLTGASDFFNLKPGEVRVEAMSFSAFDPLPGTYHFRLSLDCENRLKDRVWTSVEVLE